jgi:hypothetical protein
MKKGMPMRGQRAATSKAKKISEYGGKEMYASKTAMMKHEKGESKAMEMREKMMAMKKGKK